MQTKSYTKWLATILFYTLLTTACGTKKALDTFDLNTEMPESPATTEDTLLETEESIPYPNVENIDLDGVDFRLFYFSNAANHAWTGIPTDFNPSETNGDVLNDAVYHRNRTVETLVNVNFAEEEAPVGYDQLGKALQTSVMANDNLYDLAFPNIVSIIGLADGGLLRDIQKLDMQIDAPYYDQKSIEEMTIANKLFYLESDITFTDKLAAIVTYFNKNITSDQGIPDLYETVQSGEWTFDYMRILAEQVTEDVDGNGMMDERDIYGISCQNDGSYYFLQAAGQRISEKDGDTLHFVAGEEKAVTVLQNAFDLMHSNIYFNSQKYNYKVGDIAAMYSENRALFLVRPLQTVFNLREMTADFGIIPMPKYDAADTSYHTPSNIYPGIILCVPQNSVNGSYIALVTDLLAAESYKKVMPSFYDTVLDSKLTRDKMSSEMLDLIFDNRVYDFGLIWDFGGFRTAIVTPKPIEVASTVMSVSAAADLQIQELYDRLSQVDG